MSHPTHTSLLPLSPQHEGGLGGHWLAGLSGLMAIYYGLALYFAIGELSRGEGVRM